jgi:flavin reductase (DIM6/NTAB) family NADH-FMN oxidoreductase RutF
MNTDLVEIPYLKFISKGFELWDKTWLLLTSGDFAKGDFNSMTVAWGGLGIMWNKPMVMVVVRPTRHTYKFINTYDSFSLCAFPEKYRSALNLLGSKSGRDGDKIKASGLTSFASYSIAAPIFKEADLVFECRKMYWEDLNPQHFLYPEIEKNYSKKDYHRIVLGEVLKIFGSKQKYSLHE